MNYVGFDDHAQNLKSGNMNSASGSSGGSSGGSSDPNHNLFSDSNKLDPFSFLDDDDDFIGKPLRGDHGISLEDLDDFISRADSSLHDAIVPSVAPAASGHLVASTSQQMTSTNLAIAQVTTTPSGTTDQDRRTYAAAAAATTAILKSWLVPSDLVAESSNGFVMVIDPGGTIEYVSDTVRCHVGHAGQAMRGQSIYNYVLQADHEKVSNALHPQNLISPNSSRPPVTSISAESDPNFRRTFGVRFLINNNNNNNNNSVYGSFLVGSVPFLKPSNKIPSLLSVFRRMQGNVPPVQQQQSSATVTTVTTNASDLFSTRVDPTSFRILHSETDKTSLSSRVGSMIGKCFLEYCYVEDQEILRAHFLETLQGTSGSTSKPYRMTGLLGTNLDPQQQRCIRVQTRSRYFKPVNHHEKGFIMSTHSMVPVRETAPTTTPSSTLTYLLSSNPSSRTATAATVGSESVLNPNGANETQQRNLLLKQLLNASFGPSTNNEQNNDNRSTGVSNSRILQLLSQHTENVPKIRRSDEGPKALSPPPGLGLMSNQPPNRSRLKRSASGSSVMTSQQSGISFIEGEPSAKLVRDSGNESAVCRENPSLVDLLAKPLPSSMSVPPPVPTKWHQEPKEKLPKDTMRKFLPPHPAERASKASASASRSPGQPQQPTVPTSDPSPLLLQTVPQSFSAPHERFSPEFNFTENDDILSEILDGLIEIQEKSPGARSDPLVPGLHAENEISSIEKYLASSERSLLTTTSSDVMKVQVAKTSSTSTLTSLLSAPPISGPQVRPIASYAIGQMSASRGPLVSTPPAAALVPRMNELLQVVPPNVSVSDAPPEKLETMLILEERRRRMSSGGGSSTTVPQQLPVRPQRMPSQPQRLPFSEVDPREVIPSPGYQSQVRTGVPSPAMQQQFVVSKSPAPGHSPSPSFSMSQPGTPVTSSFQTFSGGGVIVHPQTSQQLAVLSNNPTYSRRSSYSGATQQQISSQPGLQHSVSMVGLSSQQQQNVHLHQRRTNSAAPVNEEKRSLLQQLLSE